MGYGSETIVVHGTQDPIIGINRAHCLGCNGGKENVIYTAQQLRRLTPIECERLQGFPDDWTKIPYRGKPVENCLDSPRYKVIGNSMAVPVMRWIGKRIQNFLGV
ncbi:Site-specific DNA methylase [Pasteurella testudinis DSM 23072]|uniref:Site-specific DNA methylase n=2 Tax=Pasteurella testudinis TaxID=761 RepID=A0A1W1UMX5_9PAST|nr:Site-specific DNA methylase [Pasteurella testudinis DSM 23072]SUB52251.1 Modification methylase HpaII [Pasteurella testudinis]